MFLLMLHRKQNGKAKKAPLHVTSMRLRDDQLRWLDERAQLRGHDQRSPVLRELIEAERRRELDSEPVGT